MLMAAGRCLLCFTLHADTLRATTAHDWHAGRDFGGSRESIDVDAEATAAREFAEETLGVFASMTVDAGAVALSSAAMAHQLRGRIDVLEIKRPLKQVQHPEEQLLSLAH